MIPIRDNIPSRRFPVVNYILIGVNIVAFLYELTLGAGLQGFLNNMGFVPERFFDLLSSPLVNLIPIVIPLIASIFLHGSISHIFMNMLFLSIFGDNVEDALGHFGYLIFYLVGGISASIFHALIHPYSTLPTIGASGAVSAVMGAYLMLYPKARILTVFPIFFYPVMFHIPALFYLVFWFFLQMASGVLSLGATYYQRAGVAWWAHIGGFLFGVIVVMIMVSRRRR